MSVGVEVWKSSQKWSAQRSDVRSIAWLGLGAMSVVGSRRTHLGSFSVEYILIAPIAVVTDHNHVLFAVLVHKDRSTCRQVVDGRFSTGPAEFIKVGGVIAPSEEASSETRRISLAETALTPNRDCADASVKRRGFER
jgi:hypothetical protein